MVLLIMGRSHWVSMEDCRSFRGAVTDNVNGSGNDLVRARFKCHLFARPKGTTESIKCCNPEIPGKIEGAVDCDGHAVTHYYR